jgi:predicted transcriptional regulator
MNQEKARQNKQPLTSQILRERLGTVSKKPLEISREHATIKKQIREALKDGPKTVPEIAEATALHSSKVLWHLMSLRKYGQVVEGEERDSYVEYTLKPAEQEKT